MSARPVVHRLIASTAMEMASEVYEDCCSKSDAFYKANPVLKKWVAKNWGMFVVTARETLGGMLGRNDIAETAKQTVYDALIADAALPNVGLTSQVTKH